MSRYIVYRWPRGRPSEVAQSDGDLRWVAADREMVSTLFRDDPIAAMHSCSCFATDT
jgi:hypothetical protein